MRVAGADSSIAAPVSSATRTASAGFAAPAARRNAGSRRRSAARSARPPLGGLDGARRASEAATGPTGLIEPGTTFPAMAADTRQVLLEQGMAMLLRHGYHDLGIAALLEATGIPRGSFYHHFASKEDFALQAIDLYMSQVHAGLDHFLG